MRTILGVAGAVALVCAASSANAQSKGALDGEKVIVVPLGGIVPSVPSSATAKMSEKLLATMREAGATASMAQSSLEDLLMLNGCSFEQNKCLAGVTRTLGVETMFVGEVSGSDGSDTKLILRRVRRKGRVDQHEISLTATTEDGLVAEVGEKVGKLYPAPAAPEAPPPPDDDTDKIVTPPPPPPDRDDDSGGGVRGYTWVITGTGLAAAAAGGVFLFLANDKQKQIDDHPDETLADLQDLEKLESDAETQFIIGDALLIGGGVVAAVGITMIILQAGGDDPPDDDRMVVAPVLTPDSAGVSLTWRH